MALRTLRTGKAMVLSVCLVFAAFMVGCSVVDAVQQAHGDDLSASYVEAVKRWTDEDVLYRDFESQLRVAATYKSYSFRHAYVQQYARRFKLDPAEYEKMMTEQADLAIRNYEFLLAVSVPDDRDRDLALTSSMWRIYLDGAADERLEPLEIRPILKDKALIRGFYPHVTPWADLYLVRFAGPTGKPNSAKLDLTITGVLGTAGLSYDLED